MLPNVGRGGFTVPDGYHASYRLVARLPPGNRRDIVPVAIPLSLYVLLLVADASAINILTKQPPVDV
jgi:hypothetical protein